MGSGLPVRGPHHEDHLGPALRPPESLLHVVPRGDGILIHDRPPKQAVMLRAFVFLVGAWWAFPLGALRAGRFEPIDAVALVASVAAVIAATRSGKVSGERVRLQLTREHIRSRRGLKRVTLPRAAAASARTQLTEDGWSVYLQDGKRSVLVAEELSGADAEYLAAQLRHYGGSESRRAQLENGAT